MNNFLFKILSFFISIITMVSLTFSGMTELIVTSNTQVSKSFDQVQYEDTQLVPQKDTDGNWTFTADRDLKVLQLTDIHIGGGLFSIVKDKKAMNAVAAMITAEKPDLVVLTGDMVYPVPFQAGTFNNKISTDMVINLMEGLGVYWTVCLGNHDSELYGDYDREAISDMYADSSLKYCLYQEGPEDVDGFGNQIIKVKNSSGITTNAFYIFDSHDYTDGDYLGIQWKYDNIHENQTQWYKDSVLAIDAANKAIDSSYPMFSSVAFLHIPLEEYKIAWNEYRENGYKNTDDVTYIYGKAGENDEGIFSGIYSENLFETMEELGSTKGVFCGHDHKNNFSLDYKGIRLTYGMSIDYLAYAGIDKEAEQRGCTVITIGENTFTCQAENYYQDKYVSKYEKEVL